MIEISDVFIVGIDCAGTNKAQFVLVSVDGFGVFRVGIATKLEMLIDLRRQIQERVNLNDWT